MGATTRGEGQLGVKEDGMDHSWKEMKDISSEIKEEEVNLRKPKTILKL